MAEDRATYGRPSAKVQSVPYAWRDKENMAEDRSTHGRRSAKVQSVPYVEPGKKRLGSRQV